MKKIIVRFWLINISISILLYLIYRFLLMEKEPVHGDFIENVLDIMDVVLSLAYSFIYLIGMLLCSLPIFFNLLNRIRNNYFYSVLTFLGLPIIALTYFLVIILIVDLSNPFNPMNTFAFFLIMYVAFLTISFLNFRKKVKTIDCLQEI